MMLALRFSQHFSRLLGAGGLRSGHRSPRRQLATKDWPARLLHRLVIQFVLVNFVPQSN